MSDGVQADGLTKQYGDGTLAASDINLRVAPGEVVAIVGPNGAGKSTTLKMLSTHLRPTSGEASVLGHPVREIARVRPLLGVALQEVGLDPLMTGVEHFEVQAALYGVQGRRTRQRADELIQRFGLGAHITRQVARYSGGTQRRLSLALALIHDPPVIIFDEPSSGLDPRSRREVWRLTRELRAESRVVLFSTQYMEEADALADRLYLIDTARIVVDGSPTELKSLVGRALVRVGVDRPPDEAVAVLGPHLPDLSMSVEGQDILVQGRSGRELCVVVVSACQGAGLELRRLTLTEPGLDDVFLHFTGRTMTTDPLISGRADLTAVTTRGKATQWAARS